ncbi:relaxase/mobilization nuclease domain-containing protein [Ruminococcus sp.]|jgi:hypothetical protein|uniref:relaxase/mobilization nuclease domain-containing protein n=1 Tax=Ruminococcus sp. TaxID=41978 RepID=UPI0025F02460|nr:relaxase/mobilization nuclease domain-containing protein [Ruminococcus sp.]
MEIFKIIHHTQGREKYRYTSLRYALDDRKVMWQCYGVQLFNPTAVYQQMKIVSDLWENTGKNSIYHFIISFSNEKVKDAFTAMRYTKEIFEYLLRDHQMVISVHKADQGSSLYHAHVIMSTTNYLDGDLFEDKDENFFIIAQRIANATRSSCLLEILDSVGKTMQDTDKNQDENMNKKEGFKRIFSPQW